MPDQRRKFSFVYASDNLGKELVSFRSLTHDDYNFILVVAQGLRVGRVIFVEERICSIASLVPERVRQRRQSVAVGVHPTRSR